MVMQFYRRLCPARRRKQMGWPKGRKRTPAEIKAAMAGRAKSLRAKKNGKKVQPKPKVQPARRKVLLRNLAKARAARWKKPAPKGCAYTIKCGLIEGQLAGPSGEVKFSGKLTKPIDAVALSKLLKGMVA